MISVPPTGAAVAGGEARARASVSALSAVGVGATTQAVNEPANSQFRAPGSRDEDPVRLLKPPGAVARRPVALASWARWLRRRVASRR